MASIPSTNAASDSASGAGGGMRCVSTSFFTFASRAICAASSVVVLFVTCAALGAPLGGFSGRTWAALAASGLVSHLGGYLAINYALGHLRATSVSVSLLSQPVITALLAIPLLGELLSAQQMIGGALVLAGIYLVNRRGSSIKG